MEVVLRLLRGESLDTVSRAVKVEFSRLEEWRGDESASVFATLII
jgi:hypothetical protein